MSAQTVLYSSVHYVQYATLAADKDLLVDGPTATASNKDRPCRRIVPGSTGNLVVMRPDGTNQTLTVTAGQILDIQAIKLVASGSTNMAVLVHW
jgi:hypothetical protein